MQRTLEFKSFYIKGSSIFFEYIFKDEMYTRELQFLDIPDENFKTVNQEVLKRLAGYLGIFYSIFFFNLDNSNHIKISCMKLSPADRDFISKTFKLGLGEFRYRNNLDPLEEIDFEYELDDLPYEVPTLNTVKKALVLNGGGKDSAVGGEIIRHCGIDFEWFCEYKNMARNAVIEASRNSISHVVKTRTSDKDARRSLSKYKGHKPLSLCFAFESFITAFLLNYKYVVSSNEHSANFGNLVYKGMEINHQYTKSYEFEKDFMNFINERVVKGIEYFSITRPLYDIQTVKIFSQYPKYFSSFISCNVGIHTNTWCKTCSKCAFVFITLASFIKYEEILQIWGENLFKKEKIRERIRKLVDTKLKPFECVGTPEECLIALKICIDKGLLIELEPHVKLEMERLVKYFDFEKNKNEYLVNYERENSIPAEIRPKVYEFFNEMLKF